MATTTNLTKKMFEGRGYVVDVVERFIPATPPFKRDAFGFADLLAYHEGGGTIVLIQCTDRTNFNARYEKIVANRKALGWLRSGGRICLVGVGKSSVREHWFVETDFSIIDEEEEQ